MNVDKDVRCAVANNISTPAEVLSELAKDENPLVRYWLSEKEKNSLK